MNRTNSAVQLRWSPLESVAFTPEQKEKFRQKMRMTSTFEVLVQSQEARSQEMNKKECLEKLDRIIDLCFFVPKKRIATKPKRSAQRKRVEEKRHRQEIKAGRRRVSDD